MGGGAGVSCGTSGSATPRARVPARQGCCPRCVAREAERVRRDGDLGRGVMTPACGSAGGLGARGCTGLRGAEAAWEPVVRSVRVLDTHWVAGTEGRRWPVAAGCPLALPPVSWGCGLCLAGQLELFRSGWPVPAAELDQGGLGCARGVGHDQVVLPAGKGWAALWGGLHLNLAPVPGHRLGGSGVWYRKRPGQGLCPGALSPSGLCPVTDPGSDGPREIGACGTGHRPAFWAILSPGLPASAHGGIRAGSRVRGGDLRGEPLASASEPWPRRSLPCRAGPGSR